MEFNRRSKKKTFVENGFKKKKKKVELTSGLEFAVSRKSDLSSFEKCNFPNFRNGNRSHAEPTGENERLCCYNNNVAVCKRGVYTVTY